MVVPGNKGKRRYMPGIDGLRAIAVIGVILYHLNIPWVQGGFSGVTVFFVLSGYLITDILIEEWNETNKINYLRFMIRRFRRLAPALMTMIFIITIWVTFTDHPSFDKLRSDLLPSLLYFTNWWYIFHEVSYFDSFGPASPFTHIWSLAIEEQFYLIWPLMVMIGFSFIKRKRYSSFGYSYGSHHFCMVNGLTLYTGAGSFTSILWNRYKSLFTSFRSRTCRCLAKSKIIENFTKAC